MDTYVADAHSLVWFIAESNKITEKASHIFEDAENAQVEVLIPTIVLAEITYIAQKKRVDVTIDEVLERIQQGDGFAVVPFDLSVFEVSLQMPKTWEIHDSIIAATARHYDAKLITKDGVLQESDEVETIWY